MKRLTIANFHIAIVIASLIAFAGQSARGCESEAFSMTNLQLAEVQAALNDLGFNAGKPDGICGPRTQAAIAGWQKSVGKPQDGNLNAESFELVRSHMQVPALVAGRLPGKRNLNDKPHGYQIVRAPVRAGRRAQRFEVRPGDCGEDSYWSDCDNDRERSEIEVRKRWKHGTRQWMGFSVWLPPDFRTSPRVRTTVGQIHQWGGPTGSAEGLKSFPPLIQLEMQGDSYTAQYHILTGSATDVRDDRKILHLADIDAMKGRWTDIMIHLDTANGNDLLEVYVNGERKAAMSGFINFIPSEYYFKYGIYRSFVSKHGGPMPTQFVVIDEVRMGRTAAEVKVYEDRPVD